MVVSASGSWWVYTYTRLEAVLEEEVAAALGIVAPVEQVDSLHVARPVTARCLLCKGTR